MKRYLLIFAMLLGAVSSWGQTVADQAAVAQQIIDMPELQQYYPVDANGNKEPVYIMQFPYAFPVTAEVSKFGKPVRIVGRSVVVTEKARVFFRFQSITITGNLASVNFDFYYDFTNNGAMIQGTAVLSKAGSIWTITESNLNGR